jgi:hypothetical protein
LYIAYVVYIYIYSCQVYIKKRRGETLPHGNPKTLVLTWYQSLGRRRHESSPPRCRCRQPLPRTLPRAFLRRRKMISLALQLTAPSGAIVSASTASTSIGLSSSPSVRLDAHNFMLW